MSQKKLEGIFDLLCDDFEKLLTNKEKPMTSADRKLLIDFLKEQGISTVGQNNQSIQSIVDKLPFSEEVEQGRAINH